MGVDADNATHKGGSRPESTEKEWTMARNRMMRYLDALGISPPESAALAEEVIRRTAGGGNPVPETMQALREILKERNIIDMADDTCRTPEILFNPAPAWNRGPMIPQKLDTTPWNRFVSPVLFRIRSTSLGPFLGLIIFLIIIYYFIS